MAGWRDRAVKLETEAPPAASGWRERARKLEEPAPAVPPPPSPEPEPSRAVDAGTAFARGGLQGSTLGWSDEILGFITSKLPEEVVGLDDSVDELGDRWASILKGGAGGLPSDSAKSRGTYEQERDKVRTLNAATREAQPEAYVGGELAGGVATSAALPAGRAAAVLTGAGAGLGGSEADSTAGQVADTAMGGAFGLVGDELGRKAGQALPQAASWLANKAGDFAERRAVKALIGQNKAAFKDLNEWDKINELGREMLDRGVVTAGASLDDIVERVNLQKELAGEAQGAALSALDELPGQQVNLMTLADRMEQEVLQPLLNKPALRQEAARVAEEIQAIRLQGYQRFLETGRPELPFSAADRDIKRALGDKARFDSPTARGAAEYLQRLYGVANDEIESSVRRSASEAGVPEAAKGFEEAKRLYGLFAPGDKAGEALKMARESNRWTSPSDYGVGIAGGLGAMLQGGDPLAGLGAGAALSLAHKLARERGPQVAAVLSNRLSHSDWLNVLATSSPDALGKWGATLSRAAAQSPSALAMAHHMLAQSDPAYQEHLERLAKGEAGVTP